MELLVVELAVVELVVVAAQKKGLVARWGGWLVEAAMGLARQLQCHTLLPLRYAADQTLPLRNMRRDVSGPNTLVRYDVC